MSKMSAGKNNTNDFVPNFHGMLTDLTTIGVQRVTGSSPLRDNSFFFNFFQFFFNFFQFFKIIKCGHNIFFLSVIKAF